MFVNYFCLSTIYFSNIYAPTQLSGLCHNPKIDQSSISKFSRPFRLFATILCTSSQPSSSPHCDALARCTRRHSTQYITQIYEKLLNEKHIFTFFFKKWNYLPFHRLFRPYFQLAQGVCAGLESRKKAPQTDQANSLKACKTATKSKKIE